MEYANPILTISGSIDKNVLWPSLLLEYCLE